MDLLQVMETRHSVRSYTSKVIEDKVLQQLRQTVEDCNRESGLNIQLCVNEPTAFSGMMAKYGKFQGVSNYIALVGKKEPQLEEKSGYYGQKIVLKAQQLGLNSCWVALSYSKGKSKSMLTVNPGEKLLMVIALGYGTNPGVPHKSKAFSLLCRAQGEMADWFRQGVEAARLAPTAMNQQKFFFEQNGNKIKALPGSGFYTKTDLGIAKYHFEIGAGSAEWEWEWEK